MENRGLLFIPDISGFTRFVTEMEIEHSRFIIQELLEVLIDSNELGLDVSEIEGDAILFYKFGTAPSNDEIFRQVEKMFCSFHRHLKSYEYRRFCQCKACVYAIDLSLKVITHYGEFTGYAVKTFQKLIGKDVIVAHQLLKNNIAQHEYWLATPNLIGNNPELFKEWMKWSEGDKETETGNIHFHYAQLSELKNEIEHEPPPSLELKKKIRCLSLTREYDRDIKTLFFVTAHFEFRNQWFEGVKEIEVDHFIPGVGSKHRCILEKEQQILITTSLSYDPETRIVFSETSEKGTHAVYYIIEPLSEQRCRLTLDFYVPNRLMKFVFDLFMKKKFDREMRHSMERLDKVAMGIVLPVEF
ncbi:MAG TPA: DUF2652 domain-containing protein [Chryseolinea sp.]|nr:DUF2652 domain-containing protein [Chryseolinea sp.]